MNLFESETDLLTKAYLVVDLLRSAKLNPAQFTSDYGVEINPRFKQITLTVDEIISCCKISWGIDITKEQIEFIFRPGTNCHLFVTHSVPQDDQTKIISYSYWFNK